jgi:hypothetical protein
VNPPLLGMRKVLNEDAARRNLGKIDESPGLSWLQGHLDYSVAPLLDEPWVLDVDTTINGSAIRSQVLRSPPWRCVIKGSIQIAMR